MSDFLYENPTLTLLNVLGVLGVLYELNVLNMPMDASLACWALFFMYVIRNAQEHLYRKVVLLVRPSIHELS